MFLLKDVWGHATEHEDDGDVCSDIIHDKIVEWGYREREFYGELELLQHKKMWDIMTHDKAGVAKEKNFSEWC